MTLEGASKAIKPNSLLKAWIQTKTDQADGCPLKVSCIGEQNGKKILSTVVPRLTTLIHSNEIAVERKRCQMKLKKPVETD